MHGAAVDLSFENDFMVDQIHFLELAFDRLLAAENINQQETVIVLRFDQID
jgi:hypothetical protein